MSSAMYVSGAASIVLVLASHSSLTDKEPVPGPWKGLASRLQPDLASAAMMMLKQVCS